MHAPAVVGDGRERAAGDCRASVYAARHFAINTDVTRLISPDLPWRQRELTFNATFPQGKETIIAVIDAPTSEAASKAAQSLTERAGPGRKDLVPFGRG